MKYVALGRHLPKAIASPLFGDRDRHGRVPDENDADWQAYRKIDLEFYDAKQRGTIGTAVNGLGYRVMQRHPLDDQAVLEVGPGALDHIGYWVGKPSVYHCVDIRPELLERAARRLEQGGVAYEKSVVTADGTGRLPFPDASMDTVVSFYSLEHLHPLEKYIAEIERVLKPGGTLIGAIPCEGGIGWGLGRFLTTRRWLKSHGISDPDKIISWEHPNFADDILNVISQRMQPVYVSLWPLRVPLVDLSLVARFIFRKASA